MPKSSSIDRLRWLFIATIAIAAACSTAEPSTDDDSPSDTGGQAERIGESSGPDSVDQGVDPATGGNPGREALAGDEVVGRTNVTAGGNRHLDGSLDLTVDPAVIDLPFPAEWVVPVDDGRWAIVDSGGRAAIVADDGVIAEIDPVDPSGRPVAIRDDGDVHLVSASTLVDTDLFDATGVEADDGTRAWFRGATDRLPHGALGDRIESTVLVVVRRSVSDPMDDAGDPIVGEIRTTVDLTDDPDGAVFEGLSPLLADIDEDGVVDVVTTISDREVGARLAVFDVDGDLVAESEPIGTANRWRHQIAVAPSGPDGEIEIVEVQTPHIGGLLQFHRIDGDRIELRYRIGEYRSHVLGSRNLDGAVAVDADGDGDLEVVVPTQSRTELAVVETAPGDDDPETRLALGSSGSTSRVSSNLALAPSGDDVDDQLRFAVGTDDGRLLVWTGRR